MEHDDIRELAEIACEWAYEKYAKRESGYTKEYWQFYKFAELVAAAEREACANIAREVGTNTETEDFALDRCYEIESAIRARGDT